MQGVMDTDVRETGVVTATVVAVVLAKVYWISRIGFDNPVLPVVLALGLSLFLVAAPHTISTFSHRSKELRWWTSHPFLVLVCLAIVALLGMIAGRTGISFIPSIAIVGFVSAVWILARWLRRDRARISLAYLIGAAIFAVWCAGVVWGSRYKMPLFWESLSYNANIHHDTFYYASMSNMMDTYGVPTTGLDGLPVIRYHFGSMWLYAKMADLLNTDVLSFYSLGYAVIMLPLFFASLFVFASELRDAFGIGRAAPLRREWRVWIVFLAATVGFIPTDALDAFAVWNSNALISESYLSAMPVFFLLMATALVFQQERKTEGVAQGSVSSMVFFALFVPATIAILGFLKLSLMVLSLLCMVYLAVRLRLVTRPAVLASIVLAVVAAGLTYQRVALPAQNQGFSPLDFMRFNSADGWQQFFPLIHLLWTWAYVALRFREDGLRDTRQLLAALKGRRLIDVEVLLVIAIGGFLPGEIVTIHGGSAVYFSDIQRWVALAFMIGRMPAWVAAWQSRRDAHPKAEGAGWKSIRLSTVLAVFVALPFVVTLLINVAQWPVRDLRANVTLRRELLAQSGTAGGGLWSLTNHAALGRGLERSAYYPIVTALRDIARLPFAERRNAALFIPQSNKQYWSMFTSDNRCSFTPLIAPAISAVAMIDGMPSYGCNVTDQYNMDAYRQRTRVQSTVDAQERTVCAKARVWGFKEVIFLEAEGSSAPRRRRIDCYLP